MSTPHSHPGNPHDTTWVPPNDQDIVNTATRHNPDGTIIVYEPAGTPKCWIRTDDWQPLPRWE